MPDSSGSEISSRVKIPGYKVFSHRLIEKSHSYKTRRGNLLLPEDYKETYSQLTFGIGIKRASWGLYVKMFVGIFSAVCLSLLAFFCQPGSYQPKVFHRRWCLFR
ncbi:MAG: hypothetical protein VCD50_07160 [Alphaproteobacteria bacterium]